MISKEPTRTMTLRLPYSLIDRLKLVATRKGTSVNDLATEILKQHAVLEEDEARADIGLAEFIGCLPGTRTDARRVNEVVGDYLEEKKRQGRL
jgi:hypothetical protein